MNINVRVLSANARAQIAALQAQVKGLQTQLATASATSGGSAALGGPRQRKTLGAFGNQIQWTGRQLQYNWTLPLLLAGGAATKFALDNEKAMTRVSKVYGDAADAQAFYMKQGMNAQQAQSAQIATFKNELGALDGAFEQLSNHYGVQQKEVLETAGAWAAAGASGLALAESTELSLKAAVLGDMELGKATESLIAIQSQYSLSTKQLNLTLAELNAIENQTGISMQGLIEGFSKSAGSAREYGIDVRHLGAMLAALVPATGTAATAGQSLKTIFSRIMAPTKESTDLMREFGVSTKDGAWQGLTAMERLRIIAGKMKDDLKETGNATSDASDDMYKLSDSQRAVVATTLGSRYQVNRFLVLMRELNEEHGYYQKALNATKNDEKVFQQASKELNTVLASSPKRLEILWYTMQNGMADAIQPMIPYLLYLVQLLSNMMTAFGNLEPSMQKFILLSLLAVAAVGPLTKMFGSLLTLIYLVATPIRLLTGLWAAHSAKVAANAAASGAARLGILGLLKILVTAPIRAFGIALGWLAVQSVLLSLRLFSFARGLPIMLAIMGRSAVALVVMWRAVFVGIVATWTGGMAALRVVLMVGSAASVGIWTKMHIMMRYISAMTWTSIRAIWVAGFTSLKILSFRSMGSIIGIVARLSMGVVAALAGPWGIAIAAVLILFFAFRKQLTQIWNNIVNYFADGNNAVVKGIISAWNMLPQGVANALTAVARIVRDAALQIYQWFSYINPFARHSPSLVENVTNGMTEVARQFGKLDSIGGHVKAAYRHISAFGRATAGLMRSASDVETAQKRAQVKKFAPGALGAFNGMVSILGTLKRDLKSIEGPMNRQQAIVDAWSKKVDVANHSLDQQQKILDRLTKTQSYWQDLLSQAQDTLSSYADAPLVGMRAMSDQIFENEMAQKRLRLEMMRMEEAGGTLDDVRSKIEALNAAQELLAGEKAGLRGAGAGSEILKQYDDQIAALEEQKKAFGDAAAPLQNMQDQLDALQRKGEEMDLTQSLQFDPLTRQIEQAANALKEMPFDEVMAGVQGAQSDIAKYTSELTNATKAVDAQQAVVDRFTAVRDKYQDSLDEEEWKLKLIKDRYDEVADAISSVESALNDVASASGTMQGLEDAKKAKKDKKGKKGYVSPAVQNFRDAAGGNFANVGGSGIPMRADWKDQSADIKKFTQDLAKQTGSMFGDINPFTSIKKKWGEFKGWIVARFGEFKTIAGDFLGNAFKGVGSGGIDFGQIMDKIRVGWAATRDFLAGIGDHIVKLWRAVWPPIQEIAKNAWDGLKKAWGAIGPELSKLWTDIKEFGPAIKGIWNIAKVVIGFIVARFMFFGFMVMRVIGNVIEPAIAMLGGIIGNVIQIVRGVFQVLSGFFALFSGDFKGGIKKIISGIGNIFGGLVGTIVAVLKNLPGIVIGLFVGMVKGVWDWIKWLWDELVGHSIVPDIINGIIFWFKKLIEVAKWVGSNVVMPVIKLFTKLIQGVIAVAKFLWPAIKAAWNVLVTVAGWFWTFVLQPIINVFKTLWTAVSGLLGLWWSGIQVYWAILKTLAGWVWNYVLVPIFNVFKKLWGVVSFALGLWWGGIKAVWNVLKTVAVWLWNNVLSPIWKKVKALWSNFVKPAFAAWWGGIKAVWNILKTVGTWVWNNVLKPIFEKAKYLWTVVKAAFGLWFSGIKTAWSKLKTLGTWVYDNVMKPVYDKIRGVWNNVKDWLTRNAGMLKKPMEGIVNSVISAVNAIIRGLNGISKILPGIDFHIDLIPKLAEGGPIPSRRVGSGFKTSGARAIVGEGKANHPEYVIPTDPTHRRRATALLASAANDLGMGSGVNSRGAWGDTPAEMARITGQRHNALNGVPMYDIGGILSGAMGPAKDLAKGAAGWMKGNIRKLATTPFTPYAATAKYLIDRASWPPAKGLGRYGLSKAWEWVRGADSAAYEKAKKVTEINDSGGARGAAALKFARGEVGKPYVWGGVGPAGYDCSGFMSALVNVYRGKSPHSRVGATGSFPWAGFKPGHGAFTIGSTPNYGGSGVGHMAGTIGKTNVESRGGRGVLVGSAARGYGDSGFSTIAHLKEGGIALANRGPALAEIGDGRYDEAVVPLPKGWRTDIIGSSGGDTVININGDLSFPNISDGSDADDFLTNLKNLAKD